MFLVIPPFEERERRRVDTFAALDDGFVTPVEVLFEAQTRAHLDDIDRWMAHPALAGLVRRSEYFAAAPRLYATSSGQVREGTLLGQWVVYSWLEAPRTWRRPGPTRWSSPEWETLEELERSLAGEPDRALVRWALAQATPVARGWGVLALQALGDVDGLTVMAGDPDAQVALLAAACALELGVWPTAIGDHVGRWLRGDDDARGRAAELLGEAGDRTHLERLVELARESTPGSHSAISALGRLAAVDALVGLIDLPSERGHEVLTQLDGLGSAVAGHADLFLERFRAGDRRKRMARLLAVCGPKGEEIIPDLIQWFVEARVDPILGVDVAPSAWCMAQLGEPGWRELEHLLDEDDVDRLGAIARAFASVRAAPEGVRERLWAVTLCRPESWRAFSGWGWVLQAVATFDLAGLAHVARGYADLIDDGLEPDNHHTTPSSFQVLGAELAAAVPPRLLAETDRARAWRWVRVLGAVGSHLTEAGREALAHEALSIDRERAANARRVLSSLG